MILMGHWKYGYEYNEYNHLQINQNPALWGVDKLLSQWVVDQWNSVPNNWYTTLNVIPTDHHWLKLMFGEHIVICKNCNTN